jgi:hypothetical protein
MSKMGQFMIIASKRNLTKMSKMAKFPISPSKRNPAKTSEVARFPIRPRPSTSATLSAGLPRRRIAGNADRALS